ncbi:MAG: response regulator [Elusimicrobia bacterium]|nr:response regulator [Elusimicrobiota bacterium]
MAKVLIIEDDGIVRDALSVFLMRGGHQVVTAADGVAGVEAFKAEMPDLVILDRALPRLSGSGVFEEIHKAGPDVPVIVLTGHDDPEEGRIYLKHGAAAFLSKGDGLSSVLDEIDKFIAPPPAPRVQARVLIAEDDEAMLGVLKRCLSAAGYSVITAADGIQAERLALEHKPDIILLDIFMPGKNGVQVLETLSRELPSAGILMISGNEDEEIARDCLQKGAFDYIPKPPGLDSLENIIRNRLFLQRGCR